MADRALMRSFARNRRLFRTTQSGRIVASQPSCACRVHCQRPFSTTQRRCVQGESFGTRLRRALGNTKIKWYPIPAALGIAFLGLGQLYRVNEREKAKLALEGADDGVVNFSGTGADELDSQGRPKKRKRIRPSGPWFVFWAECACDNNLS